MEACFEGSNSYVCMLCGRRANNGSIRASDLAADVRITLTGAPSVLADDLLL